MKTGIKLLLLLFWSQPLRSPRRSTHRSLPPPDSKPSNNGKLGMDRFLELLIRDHKFRIRGKAKGEK
jgi:hypothetical protein